MWAYWPVRWVAREGQHSGKEAIEFSKVVPSAASSAPVCGMYFREAAVWSSVIITTTLGRAAADPANTSSAASAAPRLRARSGPRRGT